MKRLKILLCFTVIAASLTLCSCEFLGGNISTHAHVYTAEPTGYPCARE